MKKFDRLPPQQRKEEIQAAALRLFKEKGFSATTMENIVEQVSLSKGGVYRIYPSSIAILRDLMIEGMHLRNAYYAECVKRETEEGRELTLAFLVRMIGDSLLLYPDFSAVYVEFLWEKRRNTQLQELYADICEVTVRETEELIKKYGAEKILMSDRGLLERLTELMNASVLSIRVLGLEEEFRDRKDEICEKIAELLKIK